MFEDLRKLNHQTRQELADETHRSVNYILKAEQATFPTPPIALLNYYVQQGYDKDLLVSMYRDYQRRQRRAWLDTWQPVPYTAGLPFRYKWTRAGLNGTTGRGQVAGRGQGLSGFSLPNMGLQHSIPTSYALSAGLCLPAAVIYRNDKRLEKAGSIKVCMLDLVEYVESGEYRARNLAVDNSEILALESSILRIALEEGVKHGADSKPATAA